MNKRVLRVASALNVLIYRLSRGKWLGRFPSGAPVCLLTTKGRKSGRSRTGFHAGTYERPVGLRHARGPAAYAKQRRDSAHRRP